jgi:hypothetical protein
VAGRDDGGSRCDVEFLVHWRRCCQNSTLTLSPTCKLTTSFSTMCLFLYGDST